MRCHPTRNNDVFTDGGDFAVVRVGDVRNAGMAGMAFHISKPFF